jgi:hypothetical protein
MIGILKFNKYLSKFGNRSARAERAFLHGLPFPFWRIYNSLVLVIPGWMVNIPAISSDALLFTGQN